ncbi:MAG: hypothetical protein KJ645_03425, partial [Planctomycetes bacterium]|nr:hypothetical protein [Planctomycetota bacterium]
MKKSEGPQPAESVFEEETENRNKMKRHEYFKLMHSAAPGIDWRVIEQENCFTAMERRRQALENPISGLCTWQELGSRNQAGRVHVAALSTDGRTLYAGADRGGLWKADLDGSNWTPISDNVYGGVHEIGVIPGENGDPDTLIRLWTDWWSQFGEGPTPFSLIHRSVDGGQTWTVPSGLGRLNGAKRLIVMNDQENTVFVLIKIEDSWQLLASTDRGESFVRRHTLSTCGDIWTPRTYDGPLYLLESRKIYQTMDGGLTWSQVGNIIPKSSEVQLLVGSEASELAFYLGLYDGIAWEFWCSKNAGETWKKKCILGSNFGWWRSLAASTQDRDVVAYGGTMVLFSRSGGSQWQMVNGLYDDWTNPEENLHVDIPGLHVFPHPDTPLGEIWYISTDGGLYDSYDQLDTVRNLSMSGLGISQYYSVHTSRRNPNIVIAGSQDQGYQRAEIQGGAPSTPGPWVDFDQLLSGDYGRTTSTSGAHDLVYSIYPGFILVQDGEEDPELYWPSSPGTGNLSFPPNETYAWMPNILADPLDPETFCFCASRLYRYYRVSKKRWKHELHSTQDFSPGFLSALAISPIDARRAFGVTADGRLYYSNDGAVTWTQSVDTGPGFATYHGVTLLPSSEEKDVCWVGGSGYGNAPVFCTHDGGI